MFKELNNNIDQYLRNSIMIALICLLIAPSGVLYEIYFLYIYIYIYFTQSDILDIMLNI